MWLRVCLAKKPGWWSVSKGVQINGGMWLVHIRENEIVSRNSRGLLTFCLLPFCLHLLLFHFVYSFAQNQNDSQTLQYYPYTNLFKCNSTILLTSFWWVIMTMVFCYDLIILISCHPPKHERSTHLQYICPSRPPRLRVYWYPPECRQHASLLVVVNSPILIVKYYWLTLSSSPFLEQKPRMYY